MDTPTYVITAEMNAAHKAYLTAGWAWLRATPADRPALRLALAAARTRYLTLTNPPTGADQ